MKKLRFLLLLSGTLLLQNVFAQTSAHLNLSDAFPSPGEKITVTYNPAGTVLEGKKSFKAVVYFLKDVSYTVEDLELRFVRNEWKGSLQIPSDAKSFLFKFGKAKFDDFGIDKVIDNNNDKGYVFLIYKNKQPVQGAYLSESSIYGGIGSIIADIKSSKTENNSLLQKEFELYPSSKEKYKSKYYLNLLFPIKDDVIACEKALKPLINSSKESDLILASQLLLQVKNKVKSDSVMNIIRQKYPLGEFVKTESIKAIRTENDLQKKQTLFDAFSKNFPDGVPNNYNNAYMYNYMLSGMSAAYTKNNQPEKAIEFADFNKNKSDLANSYNQIAYDLAKSDKNLELAATLSQTAIKIVKDPKNKPGILTLSDYKRDFYSYTDTYAYVLLKQNKNKEALIAEQEVYNQSNKIDQKINEHYALILAANNNWKQAQSMMEQLVISGNASDEIKASLKGLYVKTKGSSNNFNEYYLSLENAAKNEARDKIRKEMVNQPAPLFTLKDTSGKAVSLAELKGKVVVLDFWATWCGPCKASFPGMQMAVNKYKNDPNVKFLFIDTWENGDKYLTGVKKFITDNNYTFHVLMDEKGEDGRQSKVVSQFKVLGIPTKFVLDKNGNIRFKHIGFEGNAESLKDEVSAMIEMAANPEAAAKTEKVTMTKSK